MTTWINKDKFKDENFSVKEGFADSNASTNPLEQFLKANPLKSVFDRETVDSRNSVVESFDQEKEINPIYDQEDNINPIGSPDDEIFKGKYSTKINNKPDNKMSKKQIKDDENRIDSILQSLFTLFITLYISYNWYFNFTEGFSKRIHFYEKFDAVNYMYFFSEYFYKIVRFFDETITVRMPSLVKSLKETVFKERFIFLLIFFMSHYIVKSIISFLGRIYKYINTFLKTGKFNLLKLIYDPKKNNVYFSIIFFAYVLIGIFSSLKTSLYDDKTIDPDTTPDVGETFKTSLTSFKLSHPIMYLILILIRVSIVYGPSVSFSSALFFIYFKFYSLFGIMYYQFFNKDPIEEANLYSGAREGSFIDMFRRIHAIMNVDKVFFEYKDETETTSIGEKFKNIVEKILRTLFNFLPFIIMFFGLFKTIPSILKIYSPMYKWTGIALLSALALFLLKFMVDEYPRFYIWQQEILNKIKII